MSSRRHNGADRRAGRSDPDTTLLDAARDCILAVGWRRTTLTDVARRADVSRMTLYRRWPDMATLLADLMVREWSGVVEPSALLSPRPSLDQLAEGVTGVVRALRDNALFRKIVEVDPELLLPYLLDRRGRTQDSMLTLLEVAIAGAQSGGTVREGDPALLARAILLTAHGFTLSAPVMVRQAITLAQLDAELRSLIKRYLAP